MLFSASLPPANDNATAQPQPHLLFLDFGPGHPQSLTSSLPLDSFIFLDVDLGLDLDLIALTPPGAQASGDYCSEKSRDIVAYIPGISSGRRSCVPENSKRYECIG